MRPARESHARGLEAALVEVGAPRDIAVVLARRATLEDDDGTLMLCLHGHCIELTNEQDEQDEQDYESMALSAADDNAEAHDRQQRGEVGWAPTWPLKDRQLRSWSSQPVVGYGDDVPRARPRS